MGIEQLAGAWRLRGAYSEMADTGETIDVFGPEPQGLRTAAPPQPACAGSALKDAMATTPLTKARASRAKATKRQQPCR